MSFNGQISGSLAPQGAKLGNVSGNIGAVVPDIRDESVTTAKLADAAVTIAKLAQDVTALINSKGDASDVAQLQTDVAALQTITDGLGTASTYGVANNLTQSASGVNVLDAVQGKVLGDRVTTNESAISTLNDRYSQLVTWVSGGGTPVRTGFQLFSIKYNSFAVQIDFVTDEATWSEDSIIATIDTAYRPPFNVQFLGYVYDSNVPTQLSIGLDGKLRIYGKTGYTSKRLRGHVFYVYA